MYFCICKKRKEKENENNNNNNNFHHKDSAKHSIMHKKPHSHKQQQGLVRLKAGKKVCRRKKKK